METKPLLEKHPVLDKRGPRSSATTQPAFTCLKLTTETLEQGVKYVQN